MHLLRALAPLTLGAGILLAQAPAGIGNFHQVNDHLYRGAQPTPAGLQNLAHLGVKTILDLRDEPDLIRAEEKVVRAAGMQFISIPMHGLSTPTDTQISRALQIVNDPSAGPVFVHCKRGADRTGTVVACYRIMVEHWQNAKALAEARSLGMSWLEIGMHRYVASYQPRPDPSVVASSAPSASQQVSR